MCSQVDGPLHCSSYFPEVTQVADWSPPGPQVGRSKIRGPVLGGLRRRQGVELPGSPRETGDSSLLPRNAWAMFPTRMFQPMIKRARFLDPEGTVAAPRAAVAFSDPRFAPVEKMKLPQFESRFAEAPQSARVSRRQREKFARREPGLDLPAQRCRG